MHVEGVTDGAGKWLGAVVYKYEPELSPELPLLQLFEEQHVTSLLPHIAELAQE